MSTSGGDGPPEFLSTHPSHGTRAEQLQEWMNDAVAAYESSSKAKNTSLPVASE
jgi:hypothetical protein